MPQDRESRAEGRARKAPDEPVDLTNCDREPIHILGAVQPFGALIALSADWKVARASRNAAALLGVDHDLLGRPLSDFVDVAALHAIRNRVSLLRGVDAVERVLAVRLRDGAAPYDVALHYSGDSLVLEFEPASEAVPDAALLVRGALARLDAAADLQGFLNEAARHVRALTGFDRVMVYRFDASANGEVVAEARSSQVPSYLGLHYPATDIPVQARALYVRNIFRVIADVNARPVPIVPQFDGRGEPLDLSMSLLRSVSPIHIEYLQNMGVGASLSISIIVEGKLWGLFACHHYSPRLPSFGDRTAAELFGSMFGLKLESRLRSESSDYERRAHDVANRLMTHAASSPERLRDAEWIGAQVAQSIPCDGVGVFIQGQSALSGLTPDEGAFRGLVSLLNRQASNNIFTTDCIADLVPEAAAYAGRAAGMLAIPMSRTPRDYVVLFRSELLRNVRWAGEPAKAVQTGPNGDRLTPRKSFEEWSELVRHRARPFTAAELRVADILRGSLLEVILRLSDEAEAERARAEERQRLLIAELNHRVRNILALIRGLLTQTRSSPGRPEDLFDKLDSRVQALARAHNQATTENWSAAPLRELVRTEAEAFLGRRAGSLAMSGPDIRLEPEAFTTLALVIHEIMTNSSKYGALSDNGAVRLAWRLSPGDGLWIEWRDLDGPIVRPPTRRGFGSAVIERSIPHELGGRVNVRYPPTGFEADICVPERYVVIDPPAQAETVPASGPARGGGPAADAEAGVPKALAGKRMLVLEDALMIALDAESLLLSMGAAEVLIASSVSEALRLLEGDPVDAAILDINLGRESSIPVARRLRETGVPFIFATGYGEGEALPPELADAPMVMKPYGPEAIAGGLAAALGRSAS